MSLLYVMHEHPSVSQSFVVNEAAAMRSHGVKVTGYALKRGAASRPAAELELIQQPPTALQLAATAAASSLPAGSPILRQAGRRPVGASARLALAEAHAAYALPAARGAGVTHIHAHFLARTADVAAALARRLGCTWSATAHGNDVFAPDWPGLLRLRLLGAVAVACASECVRERLLRHVEAFGCQVRTKVVHCGIDTSSLGFGARVGDSAQIVSVGRLVETKGYLTAVPAVTELMRADRSLRWTIIGDGPLRDPLERLARDAGLADRIELTGALEHREALSTVAGAGVFLLPCQRGPRGESDGIPVALMEAMAVGVPVVTSPVGGISELVDAGETGFLVAPGDPAALFRVLRRVFDPRREEELGQMCSAARDRVVSEFDQAVEAQSLLDLLADLTDIAR